MGRSITINCLGHGPETKGPDGVCRRLIYRAMNRLEIFQELAKARTRGEDIEYWYSQTRTGTRVLGTRLTGEIRNMADIPRPKNIIRCVCPENNFCSACNWSGLTTRAWLAGYRDWQIEEFKKENLPAIRRE